jgi:hypothetical protein
LQGFSEFAVERLSVAYWLILARLQYGRGPVSADVRGEIESVDTQSRPS